METLDKEIIYRIKFNIRIDSLFCIYKNSKSNTGFTKKIIIYWHDESGINPLRPSKPCYLQWEGHEAKRKGHVFLLFRAPQVGHLNRGFIVVCQC